MKEQALAEEEDTVIPFRQAYDSGIIGKDWLTKLPEGTIFLASRFASPIAEQFTVVFKRERCTRLLRDEDFFYVVNSKFCKQYELIEVQDD